jgi:molecular chaperone GrpE
MKKNKKNQDMSEEKKSVQDAENIDYTPADEKLQNEQFGDKEPAEHTGQNESISEETSNTAEIKLAEAETKLADIQDKFLRVSAEFDNYRKRTLKEKAELIKNGSADVITEILPVIDDLERAIANSQKADDFQTLKDGIELIYNKLMHTLEQKGLQKISPKDEPFDTDFHEAIAMIPASDEQTKGKVLDCTRDGYKLNDKVLRHAQVAVAQ